MAAHRRSGHQHTLNAPENYSGQAIFNSVVSHSHLSHLWPARQEQPDRSDVMWSRRQKPLAIPMYHASALGITTYVHAGDTHAE
jgi:hypothetical protein